MQQWRTTSNALEHVSELHNDCLLVLDELGQVKPKEVSDIVYTLGNSNGKNRLSQNLELKKTKEWTMSILSSGEISIADKISISGDRVKAGQLVRSLDIDCLVSEEYGIYDALHHMQSGCELSDYLKAKCTKFYGTVAEAFVQKLADQKPNVVNARFEEVKKCLIERCHISKANGQVLRVADIFAVYALTGALACEFGVFTHRSNELVDLIFDVFELWIKTRGTQDAFEDCDIIKHVTSLLFQNESRFEQINCRNGIAEAKISSFIINNRLGYCVNNFQNNVLIEKTYYMLSNGFKFELCRDYNERIAKNVLKKENLLITEKDGDNLRAPSYLGDLAKKRVVTIKIPSGYNHSNS